MLDGYTNANMSGDIDSCTSTSMYFMTFAGVVSWQSKLQKCVALSTTEAEYIAGTEACKELLWMMIFLEELGLNQERYILYCDSQSAIHLAKNAAYHAQTKHIQRRYHWIRKMVEEKLVAFEKVHTDQNGFDMLTKILPKSKIEACHLLGSSLLHGGRVQIFHWVYVFFSHINMWMCML